MQIASAIGSIAAASLGAIIVVVVLFGLGVLGIARYQAARTQGTAGSVYAVIGASAAFVACFAIALFGLYLIVVR